MTKPNRLRATISLPVEFSAYLASKHEEAERGGYKFILSNLVAKLLREHMEKEGFSIEKQTT